MAKKTKTKGKKKAKTAIKTDGNHEEGLENAVEVEAPGDANTQQGTTEGEAATTAGTDTAATEVVEVQEKLYKSTRLKGYLTLVVGSVIFYDSSLKSTDVFAGSIPATEGQQNYAVAVAFISLIIAGSALLMHLDRITPLEKVWIVIFKPKSRFELVLAVALVCWWSVTVGVATSVQGIAGDGKGQYNLYYSSWACCCTSYWILERWWVAAGYSSFKSFITSWPNRSPGWLCILFLSICTMAWYLDLWRNSPTLRREEEENLLKHFDDVPLLVWQFLVTLAVLTSAIAAFFVLVEIFRETKPNGSNVEKTRLENTAEGLCLLVLNLAWIPSIILATLPAGPASKVGNAYFWSWLLVIFIAETGVWFVHDLRERIHQSLTEKETEYREKQREVLEQARAIQKKKMEEDAASPSCDDDENDIDIEDEDESEFYDTVVE